MFSNLRILAAAVFAAALAFPIAPAFAQSGDAKPAEKPAEGKAAEAKDPQRQVDEFAEAARTMSGPAGHAECVWLGRRVVGLLWRDDLDTAFRHLDLYDRFGCPGPHIQSAFSCVVRQGPIDLKAPQTLNARVHSCWLNPGSSSTAASTMPPVDGTATAGAAAKSDASPEPQPANRVR
jgi:hypothetical protein